MKQISNPAQIRDYFKRWPHLYYFVLIVLSPIFWSGLSQKRFLAKYTKGGKILNLGSGPDVIPGVTNVDISPYKGVAMVADIMELPVVDGSVDAIISNTVLEHVKEPTRAVAEMYRVLRVGAHVYITVPFLYPFHASPDDYTRWTHAGVKQLLKDFEIVELGVRAGPFSNLTIWLTYIGATIFSFGSEWLYWFLVNLLMLVFFPLKLLDIIGARLPFAINLSAIVYVVARRK